MKTAIAAAILALTVPAAAQTPDSGARVVPVALYSFGFAPNPIVLRAGRPVTLLLENRAGVGHEFKARYFFRTSRIIAGAVDQDGRIDLAPHQSTSVTLVPARGTYDVHCGHFMHEQLGMHAKIYVE